VEIDLALAHNTATEKPFIAANQLLAVVKADAWSWSCNGCDYRLAIQTSWLGVTVRRNELRSWHQCSDFDLGATHSRTDQSDRTGNYSRPCATLKQAVVFQETRTTTAGGSIPVHIKIDTGMSRFGTTLAGSS